MARHNELHDGVADLDGKSFTFMHVHDDPPHLRRLRFAKDKSSSGREHNLLNKQNDAEATEKMGSLLVCDLWQNENDSVNDIRVVNTDAK